MIHVCPTALVSARPDVIWHLLTTARELAAWTDTTLVIRFPPGWRGHLIQTVLGRAFVSGPAESLARLRRAAER